MLEFKCPLSRKPKLEIPKHYIPQLWSGLAVSNVAAMGVFVDSIFRKCSLDALGYNSDYDTIYHNKDQTLEIGMPVCWGIIGLYSKIRPITFMDLGTVSYSDFNYIVDKINKKTINAEICSPYFATKRFNGFNTIEHEFEEEFLLSIEAEKSNPASSIEAEKSNKYTKFLIKKLEKNTPKDYYFLGVLSWKLFYSSYIPIKRRPGFLDEIKPLINQVHQAVSANKIVKDD